MSNNKSAKFIKVSMIWLGIVGAVVLSYRFVYKPQKDKELVEATGSESSYKEEITIAADGFGGYAILRSDFVRDDMKSEGYRLDFIDDGADYGKRIRSLRDGEVDFAVFTIDSYLNACVELGENPGTFVLVIDESKGADAIVAYEQTIKTMQDMNNSSARFILTPNSPSEHLGRMVKASFRLPSLPDDWIIEADGSGDALSQFKSQDRGKRQVAVLWEPDASRALEIKGVHTLIDTSKIKGQIIDVLVVGRQFLQDKPEAVKHLVEAHLRGVYHYTRDKDALIEMLRTDSEKFGTKLKKDQAENIAKGIEWRNTVENFAAFGLVRGRAARGQVTVEDSISDISGVLVKTGKLGEIPFDGQESSLYYDQTLMELRDSGFHPGKTLDIIEGAGVEYDTEKIRGFTDLRNLTDDEWASLMPVGQMDTPSISFGRGKSTIMIQGKRNLDNLAVMLGSFPQYYLSITGNARAEGDPQANMELAESRAQAVLGYLKGKGIDKKRMKGVGAPPSNRGGDSQSVSFVLGQLPY